MELEELKKSWNALDEHLKDKEFIKEEELEKLIRHADKGIHAIARLNIKLILISLPILILFLAEVLLHNRLNPIYIIIIFAWIPAPVSYTHLDVYKRQILPRTAYCPGSYT